jgi:hypothetical protein
MSKVLSWRPSPAMAVALLALIVALSGSAYAATKIGTKQIKAGAVTAKKIRTGAVTAGKIRPGAVSTEKIAPNAVTGEQVLESSLGTVPRAEAAARADLAASAEKALSAESAQSAQTAEEFSRYFTTGVVTLSKGEETLLASIGPFAISGVCEDLGFLARRSRTVIETSAPGSYLVSDFNSYNEANFEPGIPAEIGNDYGDDEPTWNAGAENEEWLAASPDGSVVLRGQATNGVYMFGGECAFTVSWLNEG